MQDALFSVLASLPCDSFHGDKKSLFIWEKKLRAAYIRGISFPEPYADWAYTFKY